MKLATLTAMAVLLSACYAFAGLASQFPKVRRLMPLRVVRAQFWMTSGLSRCAQSSR